MDWPLETWTVFCDLAHAWILKGLVPTSWKQIRQVFLVKEGAETRPDGSVSCAGARPIAVQCILWRVIASTWVRRVTAREWLSRWIPPTSCGAVPNRGVHQAVQSLDAAFQDHAVLISLDYSKCALIFFALNLPQRLSSHSGHPDPWWRCVGKCGRKKDFCVSVNNAKANQHW